MAGNTSHNTSHTMKTDISEELDEEATELTSADAWAENQNREAYAASDSKFMDAFKSWAAKERATGNIQALIERNGIIPQFATAE